MINKLLDSRSLVLKLDAGFIDGKSKTVNRTFNGIKFNATEQQIYDVGTAIAGLQDNSLLLVSLKETSGLIQE